MRLNIVMKLPVSPWIIIMGICVILMAASLLFSQLGDLFWFTFYLFVAVACIWAIKRIFFPETKK
jgi:hypothetical protein